jgi:hypothetical protein
MTRSSCLFFPFPSSSLTPASYLLLSTKNIYIYVSYSPERTLYILPHSDIHTLSQYSDQWASIRQIIMPLFSQKDDLVILCTIHCVDSIWSLQRPTYTLIILFLQNLSNNIQTPLTVHITKRQLVQWWWWARFIIVLTSVSFTILLILNAFGAAWAHVADLFTCGIGGNLSQVDPRYEEV